MNFIDNKNQKMETEGGGVQRLPRQSDYADVVLGRPIFPAGGKTPGLKWTVSPQPPAAPKAGELWVGADPSQVRIDQVIHLQSSKKEVATPKPNAIYVIIPANGYSFVETPVTVDFFNNKKYRLNAQCPYIFVTGDSGQVLDIVRGVYTGTQWKTWGERPDIPEQWELVQAISATTTWTPPNPGQWYRVHVFGKCGSGGHGTWGGKSDGVGGGAGGNSGGYSCSIILLEDSVPCTINASVTSFGDYLSATSGGNGGDGGHNGGGVVSSVVGEGIGGTEYNLSGFKGGAGGNRYADGRQGGNKGALGGRGDVGGGGGGGARLPTPYDNFPYVPNDLTVYRGGYGGSEGQPGGKGSVYPALNLSAPNLYGGGCAGGGEGNNEWDAPAGTANPGSPGLIIIEKGQGV